jgi:hypothetical protein
METNNFKSSLFTQWLNPWGMKLPASRKTTALPGPAVNGFDNQSAQILNMFVNRKVTALNKWAAYDSLEDACKDILYWMIAVKFPQGIEQLYEFVVAMKNEGYFGEESVKSYYDKILAINK